MDFSGTADDVGFLAAVELAAEDAARFETQNFSTTKYDSATASAALWKLWYRQSGCAG